MTKQKKNILTIVGARPQFIKASVVSRALLSYDNIQEYILHTGQHFDSNMSDLFFEELSIPKPYKNLNLSGSGLHGAHTANMLTMIEQEMMSLKPDFVLLYGDTNSTLSGALAAAKLHVPIGHVEAGARNYDKKIPEEVNRIISDHLATFLFCSTEEHAENLRKENIENGVYYVGDVMIDSLYLFKKLADQKVSSLDAPVNDPYILLTLHRQETTADISVFKQVIEGFRHSPVKIIFPMHPRTRNFIKTHNIQLPEQIFCIDPVGYLDMIHLISKCKAVFTDSGGLQKESVALQKKCYTIFEQTAWPETVNEGWNFIVGRSTEKITSALQEAVKTNPTVPFPTAKYYGAGNASDKIAKIISESLK